MMTNDHARTLSLPATRALCLALGFALMLVLAGLCAPIAHAAGAFPANSADGAWVKKSGCMYYTYADGSKAKGLVQIGSKTYYFDKKGVQRTGWRKTGGGYRFFTQAAGAKGSMVKGKVVNGIKLYKNGIAKENKAALEELKLMYAAQKRCDKLAKPLAAQSTKLRACFTWLWRDCRERGSYSLSFSKGWHRKFAWDIFKTKSGSCESLSIGFAYLANACGAKSVKIKSSGGHTWALVNGLVCDPEQAKQGRGWGVYMNAGLYGNAGIHTVTLNKNTTQWSRAKATNGKAAKFKDGWVKSGSGYCYYLGGKKLKKQWLTLSGKTFYLKSNGKMATISAKVKGSYYVFGTDGVLQKGKKTRTVKIGGATYRVAKSGKAKAGWTKDKTRLYLKTGELACGARWVDGKLMIFSDAGVYDAALTGELAPLCVQGSDATRIVEALGTAQKRTAEPTCRLDYLGGFEITYTHAHIVLRTYCAADGPELFNYIEAR